MKLFPEIHYNFDTSLSFNDIEDKINYLLLHEEYEGFAEGNKFILNKIVQSSGKLIPNIIIKIKDKGKIRNLSIDCMLMNKNKIFILILIILLGIIELVILYKVISNHAFNFMIFAPFVLGAFIYLINYINLSWESSSFKYLIRKYLK